MIQLDLFNGIPEDSGFPEYHFSNPEIYIAFKKYTFQAIEKGFKNFSSEFIFNIIRWETGISGNDEYKINNNYKAFYSRLFMNEYTELKGFFRIRKSKYDKLNLL